MTFTLPTDDNPRIVKWRVVIPAAEVDGEDEEFVGQFKMLSDARRKELAAEGDDFGPTLREAFVGWDEGGIRDADGKPVPVSDDARETLIGHTFIAFALWRALNEVSMGAPRRGRAVRNSTPPASSGPRPVGRGRT